MSIEYRQVEYQGSQLARVYDKTKSGWDGLIGCTHLGYDGTKHRPFNERDIEKLVIEALVYLTANPNAVIEFLMYGELEDGVDPEKIIRETKLKAPVEINKHIPTQSKRRGKK